MAFQYRHLYGLLLAFLCFFAVDEIKSEGTDLADVAVLKELLQNVGGITYLPSWTGDDPCGSKWDYIQCHGTSVTAIELKNTGLHGQLPSSLNSMANLQSIALQGNNFSGPLPSFNGLSSLQSAYLDYQSFSEIPSDFFHGLSSLTLLTLDYSPLNISEGGWMLPGEIVELRELITLSLTSTHLTGALPSFLALLPNLQNLHLAYNHLYGSIPPSFASAPKLVSLQLNNQIGAYPLNGTIAPVAGIQSLSQLWLQVNAFSGPIPDELGALVSLKDCRLNDNNLVGPIPVSFESLTSLSSLAVQHNSLDGPLPRIPWLKPENFTTEGNGFCSDVIGDVCAEEVNILIDFLGGFGYPLDLSSSWVGNNPCFATSTSAPWTGISCNPTTGKVITINLPNHGLTGSISPSVANLSSLQNLILSDNAITGTIPSSLRAIKSLHRLSLQNNNLSFPVPSLPGVSVNLTGNPMLDKATNTDIQAPAPLPSSPSGTGNMKEPTSSLPSSPAVPTTDGSSSLLPSQRDNPRSSSQETSSASSTSLEGKNTETNQKSTSKSVLVGGILGSVCIAFLGGVLAVLLVKKRKDYRRGRSPNAMMVHPDEQERSMKLSLGNRRVFDLSESLTESLVSGGYGDNHGVQMVVDSGTNLLISIQVLRNVTQNFSQTNVLGKGGFGVVYRGELDDGTKIAVKRMESAVVNSKGLKEFQSEIAVLTKVRHRHLVALLGYCIDGNERLLVYEYMPLGPLSHHLFEHQKLGLTPLTLKRRLSIALDVARGMEYLHGLAREASFIHRDLKSSNILLGDDYRAKVSDFGLVKLASDDTSSVETRLAGTFGYLAPEYAVTGRVTTKSDVFSYGVVLMELITGRKALDETQTEEDMHLVAWFRRMSAKNDLQELMKTAMDPSLVDEVMNADNDTSVQSFKAVAELAGHCTRRDAWQRPDMSHAVNVLLPLVELWKPADMEGEDGIGIDLHMTLPQALKKWQAYEGVTGSSSSSTTTSTSSCTTMTSSTTTMESSSGFFTHYCCADLDTTNGSMPSRPLGFAESFTSNDGR